MARILRALRGEERLAIVFWGFCVAGTLVVGVLLYWVSRAFPALAAVVTGVPFVAYFLCAHISLWMCAFNVKRKGWGDVARCSAVLIVICYFIGITANCGPGHVGIQRIVLPANSPKE
ncbi:MAG: hypothetical protein QOK23_2400 [Gammaproteobacteria bacterium]|jgi:hypothetical protein|nr:hypothetical protein [Gammaproteobacteria bacterium]